MPVLTIPAQCKDVYLDVSCKVKRLLAKRKAVYLTDEVRTYKLRVHGVRVCPKHQLLQVKTCSGWSSVWHTEMLVDEYGECLFVSPGRFDYDEEASEEALEKFVNQIGLLPWCKAKEVY